LSADVFFPPLDTRPELDQLLEAFAGWNPDLHPRDWLGRFRLVRSLGGGGGGAYLVRSERSGKEYVAKRGNAPGHVRSEYAANQIYEAGGVRVPKTRYEDGIQVGEFVKARELNEYLERTPDGWRPKSYYEDEWRTIRGRIAEGFAMDALLANWDVLGPQMNNVMIDRDLNPVRVDQGGAMAYSGFGTPKPKWDPTVGEFETMRNPERSVSVVFGALDDEDVREQIRKLPEKKILARVDALVASGDLSADDAETIRDRLAYMRKWASEDSATSFRVAAALDAPFLAPLAE
jgi:hypothetical protein